MSDDFPVKVNVEVKDESVRTVLNAVLDILSAPTELLGWLGDNIRIHRANSALRCFSRSKEIADEAGLVLKAPPVKFLSQYIEYCSLEDEADEDFIEWWARLLVDASTSYRGQLAYFANVLRQLSPLELELLEVIARNGRSRDKGVMISFIEDAKLNLDFEFIEDEIFLADRATDSLIDLSIDSITLHCESPGSLALDIFIVDESNPDTDVYWQVQHPDYLETELASWEILESLQLIRMENYKLKSARMVYRVRRVVMTELGADFYLSCHDHTLRRQRNIDARYERIHKSS